MCFMKKLVIIATVTAGLLGLTACGNGDPEVVVETSEGNITQDEFYEELKAVAGETVLQNMVLATILESKYDVDDALVDEQLDTYREQYGEMFEMLLQQQGFQSEDEFRQQIRLQLLQEEALAEDVEVTEEEIERAYSQMNTELEASHILMEDPQLAYQIYERAVGGEDFAALAEEYSIDSGSAIEGGSLGFFSRGDMVPEFEEAAFNLEVGEISEPIQSTHGFHIIYLTDTREAEGDVAPLEDVRDQLHREIAASKVDNTTAQQKFIQLLEDANIDVKIEEFQDIFTIEMPEEDIIIE